MDMVKRHSEQPIPLNQAKKGKSKRLLVNVVNENRLRMQRLPYMSDHTLVPRVEKYLESINVNKIDLNVMADDLQRSYKEYARLKRNGFRASVKKAYAILRQKFGFEDQDSSSSDDDQVAPESSGFQNRSIEQNTQLMSRPVVPTKVTKRIDGGDPRNSSKVEQLQIKNVQIAHGRGKKRKLDGDESVPRHAKKKKSLVTLQEPSVTLADVGDKNDYINTLWRALTHMIDAEVYKRFSDKPRTGILLCGPPGSGKTLLAHAIAGQFRIPLLEVRSTELVSGISGESEDRIRELFEHAACSTPCILFIDEIDIIAADRNSANKDMERRMVTQLAGCLEDLRKRPNGIVVIAATNRPEVIDPALRLPGRFSLEISLDMPDIHGREQILKVMTANCQLGSLDLKSLAKQTPGFLGADLKRLAEEATQIAIERVQRIIYDQDKLTAKRAEREKQLKKNKKVRQQKEASATASEDTIDLNKSDPEIVMEEDAAVAKLGDDKATPGDSSDDAILVVDDEPKGSLSSTAETTTKPNEADTIDDDEEEDEDDVVQGPMASDFVTPMSQLDYVNAWLQDPPITRDEHNDLCRVRMEDFQNALKVIKPAAKREGFATVPKVTWDDVGSLAAVRKELQRSILGPIKNPEKYERLLSMPAGVLLCGPPGCGKTLVAKAVANEAGINFLSVKGPELLNMYVGQSEEAVRKCFLRAQRAAPCVIFFDEFDALCPKRSDNGEGGVSNRVVTQLLAEMDGAGDRAGVYILAATNRPEALDPAVLRPGRFSKTLYVGVPTAADRLDILRVLTKNGTVPYAAPDVDFDRIANSHELEGYTGADLKNLVNEASLSAVEERDVPLDQVVVTNEHYRMAIAKIEPSVSEKDRKHYEKLRKTSGKM